MIWVISGIGVIFLLVAALTFQGTPVAALFYAAIGLGLMVPGAALILGAKGVVVTLPASFVLAIVAVILQSVRV